LRRTITFGVALAVGLASAACSTSTGGNTSPPPSVPAAGPSTATSSAQLTAPPVSSPLNVTKFEHNPCDVLTSAQASRVANLTKTDGQTNSTFPICGWADGNHNSIAFSFVRGGGLSDAYEYQGSQSGYFKVASDVDGYPAVYSGTTDDRTKGGCQMIVGVRNDTEMIVNSSFRTSSPYYSDPCSVTQKAAEAAIVTLKGGA
jgi:uncharacterized protein DUF3558